MLEVLVLSLVLGPMSEAPVSTGAEVRLGSAQEAAEYFDSLAYNIDNPRVFEGIPRIHFQRVPRNWKENRHVPLRKSVFFRAMLPLILEVNAEIASDRRRLLAIGSRGLQPGDASWLEALAKRYGVESSGGVDEAGQRELLLRVDALPPSMALAQAAVESGWSRSRFAREGNALFGQWTWSGGLKATGSSARLAAFETPLGSARSYALNLNTHRAYRGLREARAARRESGEPLDGRALAAHLGSYSEKGDEYVTLLQRVIDFDGVGRADGALLADEPIRLLVPVGSEPAGR